MEADDDCRLDFHRSSYTFGSSSFVDDLLRIVFSIGILAAHPTPLVIGIPRPVWRHASSCIKMRFRRSSGKANCAWLR